MPEDFGEKIGAIGQNIWKKAQGAVYAVTTNIDIVSKNRELTQLYADIGREFCLSHGDVARREMPELFEKATAIAKEISDMQGELNLQKGFRKCPACGVLVPVQAAYCPACGTAMPPIAQEDYAQEAQAETEAEDQEPKEA